MFHNSKVIAFCITLLVITAWSSLSQAKSLKALMQEAADAAPTTSNKTIDDFTFAPMKAPKIGFMNRPKKPEYREVAEKYMTESYFTAMDKSINELNGESAAKTCKIKIYAPPEGSDETDRTKFTLQEKRVNYSGGNCVNGYLDGPSIAKYDESKQILVFKSEVAMLSRSYVKGSYVNGLPTGLLQVRKFSVLDVSGTSTSSSETFVTLEQGRAIGETSSYIESVSRMAGSPRTTKSKKLRFETYTETEMVDDETVEISDGTMW